MKLGRRLSSKNIVLFVRRNEKGFHRLGIVVKKEVGTAPFRNRMKRYFREFFRLHKGKISVECDMVVLIKKGCSIKRYDDAEADLKRLLHVQ
jgi:ribonuclease P protein component